jgi:hypothetical protein
MQYIEAPTKINYEDYKRTISCFLAGGITGCPNWQDKVVKGLEDTNLMIFNPRRKNFPMGDPEAGKEQILWENEYLNKAHIFSIWFCAEQIQPICLYELGKYTELFKRENRLDCISVGIDPNYPRRLDVKEQLRYTAPNIKLHYSLEEHIDSIRNIYHKIQKRER